MSNNVVDIVVQLTDKNTQAGLEKIAAASKGTVAELAKLKTEMLTIGAGAGITGLGSKLAKEALDWNLSVKKMQSLTGATAEQASTFISVANYMGVATDVSTTAFAKFAKAVSNAQDKMQTASAEGKLATDMFSRLGISIDQIQGKNTLEVFQIIQERLRGMKDGAEKTRVEMELFGKTGYQLHGMLNMSAEAMKQVEDRARAMGLIIDDEAAKLINPEELKQKAIDAVEQNGIVFIDEIDKICKKGEYSGADVSREGVQRDLLPLVEGSTVNTKHGMVKTDHILFIASGAFQVARPSDLIPELQGRLPIRVELSALTAEDFERILTEPNASLTEQYKALMATEGVSIEFTQDAIKKIAEAAFRVNEKTENIGARRLHTVMERLMDKISFDASEMDGQTVNIDAAYVIDALGEVIENEDLSRFIL